MYVSGQCWIRYSQASNEKVDTSQFPTRLGLWCSAIHMGAELVSFSTTWGESVCRQVFSQAWSQLWELQMVLLSYELLKIRFLMEESNYLKKLSGITHCAAVSGLMSLLISVNQAQSLKGHFTVILCSERCQAWQQQR